MQRQFESEEHIEGWEGAQKKSFDSQEEYNSGSDAKKQKKSDQTKNSLRDLEKGYVEDIEIDTVGDSPSYQGPKQKKSKFKLDIVKQVFKNEDKVSLDPSFDEDNIKIDYSEPFIIATFLLPYNITRNKEN